LSPGIGLGDNLGEGVEHGCCSCELRLERESQTLWDVGRLLPLTHRLRF